MNEVQLAGYLGASPELRYTDGGTAVANIRLATDEGYTNRDGERVDQTEWHTLTLWGRRAEVANEYLSKGDFLIVNRGKLQTREWEDQDGNTRLSTEVKVLEFEFGPNNSQDEDVDTSSSETEASSGGSEDEDAFEPDDKLPF